MDDTGKNSPVPEIQSSVEQNCESLRARIMDLENYIDARKLHWEQLNADFAQCRETLASREAKCRSESERAAELGSRILNLERTLAQTREKLEEREAKYQYLEAALGRQRAKRDTTIAEFESEVNRLRELNQQLTDSCSKASRRIRRLKSAVEERSTRIQALRNELREVRQGISHGLDASSACADTGISAEFHLGRSELEHEIEILQATKKRLENKSKAQRKLIEQLEIELEAKKSAPAENELGAKRLTLLSQSLQRVDAPAQAAAEAAEAVNEIDCPGLGYRQLRKRHKFIALNGGNGKEFMLSKERMTIGRSSRADIRIRDTAISRHHACLTEREDGVVIEDIASRNGLLVNDQLTQFAVLRDGDIVSLGSRCKFRFVEEVTAAEEAS